MALSNTLTDLTSTIISNAAIEAFTAAVAPLKAFALNVSPDPAQRGDKVKVLWVSAASAAVPFVAGTGYEVQDSTAVGLDISLSSHSYVSWGLTDTELSQNPQINIERFGRQKGFQLAKKVLQTVWAAVTNAHFGAAGWTGAANTFDSDDVADLEQACDEADWPDNERSLILKPSYHTPLVKDAVVAGTLGVGQSAVISRSSIPTLHNFALLKSNLIPDNGENLIGMAVQPDALLVAMRYLAPQEGNKYFQAAPITDPNGSGFTIGIRDWYDEQLGQRQKVLECVYGVDRGNAAALKRLVSI